MIDLTNFENPVTIQMPIQKRKNEECEWWDYMSKEDKAFCINNKDSKDKKDIKIIKLLKDKAKSSRHDHCNALN